MEEMLGCAVFHDILKPVTVLCACLQEDELCTLSTIEAIARIGWCGALLRWDKLMEQITHELVSLIVGVLLYQICRLVNVGLGEFSISKGLSLSYVYGIVLAAAQHTTCSLHLRTFCSL